MKTFLIDLENVKNQGFTGIDKLAAEDRVFVFYSDGANTLNIPTIQLINRSACSVEYVPLQRSGHNAMDFQIVGLLGFLIGSEKQGYFGIISQDQGYLAPVEFFMDHSADVLDIHVLVTPNILTAVRKWDAQAQNSRKVLTSGKKNENTHSRRSSEEVIDVEVVQSQSTEEVAAEMTEELKVNADVVAEEIMVAAEEVAVSENVELAVEETKNIVQEDTVSESVEETETVEENTEENAVETEAAEAVKNEENQAVAAAETVNATEEAKAETAEPVGVYVEEISNAFVGAIVDSADSASSDEEMNGESTEKKSTRSSRNKKKKPAKKSGENAAKGEAEKTSKAVKAEETVSAPAEKKEKTKAEKKTESAKTDSKTADRSEKKKEPKKNNKKVSDVSVDPQDIQKVHALIGDKLNEEQVQFEGEIVKAVQASDGKNHFYQYFNHVLGREKGGNLYHAIRNDYEKLVKALK